MTLTSFQTLRTASNVQLEYWMVLDLFAYPVVVEDGDRPVGTIKDLLVDREGRFRYWVAEVSFSGSFSSSFSGPQLEKTILIPIGLATFDYGQGRVYVNSLTAARLAKLPAYRTATEVDPRYEQRVRDAYRPAAACRSGHTFLQHPYTVDGKYFGTPSGYVPSPAQTAAQTYDRHPTFYGMSDRENHQPLKDLENLLVSSGR